MLSSVFLVNESYAFNPAGNQPEKFYKDRVNKILRICHYIT